MKTIFVVAPTPNAALMGKYRLIILLDPPHFTSTNSTYLSEHQQSIIVVRCFD
jgi:hypothetical protein